MSKLNETELFIHLVRSGGFMDNKEESLIYSFY